MAGLEFVLIVVVLAVAIGCMVGFLVVQFLNDLYDK